MKIKALFATFLTLAWCTAGYAQTLDPSSVAALRRVDKAELDQFFDRLAEKNKAMGSLRAGPYPLTRASFWYSILKGCA